MIKFKNTSVIYAHRSGEKARPFLCWTFKANCWVGVWPKMSGGPDPPHHEGQTPPPALCAARTRGLREELPHLMLWGLHCFWTHLLLWERDGSNTAWLPWCDRSLSVNQWPKVLNVATFPILLATEAWSLRTWGIITGTSHIKNTEDGILMMGYHMFTISCCSFLYQTPEISFSKHHNEVFA